MSNAANNINITNDKNIYVVQERTSKQRMLFPNTWLSQSWSVGKTFHPLLPLEKMWSKNKWNKFSLQCVRGNVLEN